VTDAFSVDLSQQVAEFGRAGAGPEVGSPVAASSGADALDSRKSDEGEVHMKRLIARLVRDDQGQDLIEYVLIGSFVSIGALVGASLLGANLNGWYNDVGVWVAAASGWVAGQPTSP